MKNFTTVTYTHTHTETHLHVQEKGGKSWRLDNNSRMKQCKDNKGEIEHWKAVVALEEWRKI